LYSFEIENCLAVDLNGTYGLSLGTNNAVLSNSADKPEISIGLENREKNILIKYEVDSDDKLWLKPHHISSYIKNDSPIFHKHFHYLSAEREGPRTNSPIQNFDFPNTGYRGQLCAQLLGDTSFNYDFKVSKERLYPDFPNPRIEAQVNKWLGKILPGTEVAGIFDAELMSAQIRMINKFTKGDAILATNIGFGMSYVLPIIVSGLIADKGSYLIIENPEAHLHPAAQTQIGRFLSLIAASGVNVIVETHSDHFLNGIQIAVAEKVIGNQEVIINYFSTDSTLEQPLVNGIEINPMGELSEWPRGFFDQTQINFGKLLNLRSNG